LGPRTTLDRASDAPVATQPDTGTDFSRAFSRNARTDSWLSRRDRFDHAAVKRHDLPRSGTPSINRGCAALPPLFRAAITHPTLGRTNDSRRPQVFPRPGIRGVARQGPRVSALRRLRLHPPRVASQRGASLGKRAPLGRDATSSDCTSAGQAPVHHDPLPFLVERRRLGEGLL